MPKTIVQISLTLRGPLLTQSSSPGQLGLDVIVARNHNNQAYIPGTLVSGKIRQSLEEIKNAIKDENKPAWFAPDLDKWLGKSSENDFAKTKQLFISDFALVGNEPLAKTRYRIKIDAERGSVIKHQLVMIESPFVSGEVYTFTGQVHFFSSPETAKIIRQHLNAAIKWFSHLGAFRTIGFGQVEEAIIIDTDSPSSTPPTDNLTPDPVRVGLYIHPEYPFCLAGKPNTDNLFKSDAIIPGGAIKGCIATTWNHLLDQQSGNINMTDADRQELRKSFSKIRISHAFPCHVPNKRPVVASLSLVKTSKTSPLYDVAQLSEPCLINNLPPNFAVEWKDTEKTLKDYPWPYIRFTEWGWDSLETELRVRTAIDREKLRSAESELFAYEQIIPDNKHWHSELDLSQVDEQKRGVVLEQLQNLCAEGLIGLGKTKSPFNIQFVNAIEPVVPNYLSPMDNNLWLITLQTDTLLGSPDILDEVSGKEELRKMYAQAWHEMSEGKLTLLRYFARQRLSGGRHRQKIMQQNNNIYRPWLLTEAGSVFVLQVKEGGNPENIENSKVMIKRWLSQGLPITASVKKWYRLGDNSSQHWQHTPFVPENGYGEIAVNLQHETVVPLKSHGKVAAPIKIIACTQEEN